MKEDLIEFSADRSLEIIRDDKNRGIFHSYLPLHVNKFLSLLCMLYDLALEGRSHHSGYSHKDP